MEINCPWLLRYVAVVAVVQNRQNLARVVDILDRRQESLEDPLLLFLHSLLIRMDFEAASKELGRCPDVFESDFFLRVNGEELLQVREERVIDEKSFMENAQLLVLELLFHVQRSITMENLAQTVSMCRQ
jgi:eukaryotic translation initiation factor 3 subunit 6